MVAVQRALPLTIIAMLLATIAVFGGRVAYAQEKWPSRPVTLVVPVGPGTITDVAGRLLADHLKEAFGQPFVVENKAGRRRHDSARATSRAQHPTDTRS